MFSKANESLKEETLLLLLRNACQWYCTLSKYITKTEITCLMEICTHLSSITNYTYLIIQCLQKICQNQYFISNLRKRSTRNQVKFISSLNQCNTWRIYHLKVLQEYIYRKENLAFRFLICSLKFLPKCCQKNDIIWQNSVTKLLHYFVIEGDYFL